MEERYELSLSPDYVSSWGFWEAIRELLQNSIDQHTETPASMPVLDYTDDILTIGNTNCVLSPSTLLLGASTKRGDAATIGQFGEGYKLAMLVLARLNWSVAIFNNDKVWKPTFEYSERYESHVLVITVTKAAEPVDGVFFKVAGVGPDEWGIVCENYLGDVPYNRILEDPEQQGRVFINGLFVCQIEALRYGYNFAPNRIRLDRDRRLAPTFEVEYEASSLWEQHGDTDALYANMTAGVPDTRYVTSLPAEVRDGIVSRYTKEHQEAVPIATQDEADRHPGQKVRIVPAALRDLLHRAMVFVTAREDTPTERLEAWHNDHYEKLDVETSQSFAKIVTASRSWRLG